MINIAVLGYGTVGSGVVKVINDNHDIVNRHAGQEVNVKYVLDLRDFPDDPIREKLVHDFRPIVEDEDVKVVVEVMGGVEPAYTFAKQALNAGKHVCTSNKELVAAKGAELLRLARANKVNFFFEASVGGGIPIIRPLMSSVTADDINEITGILNGTTNYILSKMENEGADFESVLKDAQERGYAERNPEADVEGYDACRKIAILSSLATGKQVDYEDIYTEGITKITENDFKYAKELKRTIKLLGVSRKVDGTIYAMVAPFMIKEDHPLAWVNGVFNAILVNGNMLDDVLFYGQGAGKEATASAVVSDVIEACKNLKQNVPIIWDYDKCILGDFGEAKHKFFVRIKGDDLEVMDKIDNIFGKVFYVKCADIKGESAFVTEEITEKDFVEKINKIGDMLSYIRVK